MSRESRGWFDALRLRDLAASDALEAIERDRARVSARLQPLLAYLYDHLFDPELNVKRLKRACGCRDNAISTQFGMAVGLPPAEYIAWHRLEVAKRLISETDLRIAWIAELLGFSRLGVFSNAFKRVTGEPPRAYRRRQGQAAAGRGGVAPPRASAHVLAAAGRERDRLRADGVWRAIRDRQPFVQRRVVRGLGLGEAAFFELLLEKSRTESRGDRQRGVALAELALESLEPDPGQTFDPVAAACRRVRAWTNLGRAHRLALDFAAAERAFHTAEELLPPEAEQRPELRGYLELSKAALRWFQVDFAEARALADGAVTLLRESGDQKQLVEALTVRALIARDGGEPQAAMPDLEEVIALTGADRDPVSTVNALLVMAQVRIDLHHLQRAKTLLEQAKERARGRCWDRVRQMVQWSAGQIALGSSRFAEARRLLERAYRGFIQAREPYYAACAAIDLALAQVASGQPRPALETVAGALKVFDALAIHREGAAARKIVASVVEHGSLSRPVLDEVRERLQRFGRDPAGRYRLSLRSTRQERHTPMTSPVDRLPRRA